MSVKAPLTERMTPLESVTVMPSRTVSKTSAASTMRSSRVSRRRSRPARARYDRPTTTMAPSMMNAGGTALRMTWETTSASSIDAKTAARRPGTAR